LFLFLALAVRFGFGFEPGLLLGEYAAVRLLRLSGPGSVSALLLRGAMTVSPAEPVIRVGVQLANVSVCLVHAVPAFSQDAQGPSLLEALHSVTEPLLQHSSQTFQQEFLI
jgi:hypothetical protein